MEVPIIDISGFDAPHRRAEVAAQWRDAFETIGFATIAGHGVPLNLIDEVYRLTRTFFEQPLERKMTCSFPGVSKSQGYVPMGRENVARTRGQENPADLCEAFSFPHVEWDRDPPTNDLDRQIFRPNRWPDFVPAFRPAVERYVADCVRVARKLMRITAVSLDLPEGYFEPSYDRMSNFLRLVEYPDQVEEPLPGQLRNGMHTDFGGFTILRQDDAPGGLQVLSPDEEWVDVRPVANTFVINAGDLIQRWTNDRFRSNLHRVINPPRHLTGSTRRLSLVLFTGPNHDAEIACLPTCQSAARPARYPPIIAQDHTAARMKQTYTVPVM